MFVGFVDIFVGSYEGMISFLFCYFGIYDFFMGSDDVGIYFVGGIVVKGLMEKIIMIVVGVLGVMFRRGLVGWVGVLSVGVGSMGGRWGVVVIEEVMFFGLFFVDRLRCWLYWLLGGFWLREEWYVGIWWFGLGVCWLCLGCDCYWKILFLGWE